MIMLDSTFLVDVLHNDKKALQKIDALEKEQPFVISGIGAYELLIGGYLIKEKNKEEYIGACKGLLLKFECLALDVKAAEKAAEISAELQLKGAPIENNDCLIAGIALTNNCNTILTRNVEHFSRIKGVKVETY